MSFGQEVSVKFYHFSFFYFLEHLFVFTYHLSSHYITLVLTEYITSLHQFQIKSIAVSKAS